MSTMHGIGGADDWSADSREIRAEASRAEETGAPHRKGWKLALGVLLLLVALGSLVGAVAQYIGESSSGFGAGEPLGLYLIGMLLGDSCSWWCLPSSPPGSSGAGVAGSDLFASCGTPDALW